MNELFNEAERELIDAARMILSDGLTRLQSREGLFPTNRNNGRSARADVLAARNGLVDYLVATYGPLRHEVAACCLIDAQGRLIGVKEFPQGKASQCEMSPRLLAGMIIDAGASAVVLVHNHPSGESAPSVQDVKYTEQVGIFLRMMDVQLVDHLVVTTDGVGAILGEF